MQEKSYSKPDAVQIIEGDNPVITVILDGEVHTIACSHLNFDTIKGNLIAEEHEGLKDLIAPQEEELKSRGIEVSHGEAYLDGRRLDNMLGKMLVEQHDKGYSLPGFKNFVEKLMGNPSRTAVNELYLFLEKARMPLCEDGDFLAYKYVRDDYKDCHTGKFDNSVGQVLEMNRNEVDDDRDRTCSYGFHFCSFDYLPGYASGSGKRVMVVKINPADVVSIPSDHYNTKGRTCRYVVHSELKDWSKPCLEGTEGKHWNPDEDADDEDEYFDDYGGYDYEDDEDEDL